MKDTPIVIEEEYELSTPSRLVGVSGARREEEGYWDKTDKQFQAIAIMCQVQTRFFLIDGGSRSGKTFICIYAICVRALKYKNSRHCVLRLRFNHAKTSLCNDTIPKVLRTCFPSLVDLVKENKQYSYYTFPNGSELWVGGLDDKARVEKILGNEYGTMYFNECSQIDFNAYEIAITRLAQKVEGMKLLALFDCNPPSIKHWTYIMWYKFLNYEDHIPMKKEVKKRYKVLKINPSDNLENVGDSYLEILEGMSEARKKRFMHGEYSTGAEGALFSVSNIHKNRMQKKDVPDYIHCGVGVDPAAKDKTTSDETGIVGGGAAKFEDDGEWHYFIELDYSRRGKPNVWANTSKRCYDDIEGDKIIGETNNGGDMVESTLRTVDEDISYIGVHASRGKAIRAEPVASLAARNRLHIVGHLPDLENEMVSWEPDESKWSPNHMDAMVWLVTWLMNKTRVKRPRIRKLTDKGNRK